MRILDALNVGYQVLAAVAQAEAGQPVTLKPIDISAGSQKIEIEVSAKVVQ